jgi:predicted membrane protein (TIGR00267 family)
MKIFQQIGLFLKITQSRTIVRRYFVVNGFDGGLTMLGIIMGFYVSENASSTVVINACLGAAVALTVSGLSSAYISETAERRIELKALENAMVSDLTGSAHGKAASLIPALIAMVNGLAPLFISLCIISPLWLAIHGIALPIEPLKASIAIAFIIIFLLGVFLGKISGAFWLWAGIRTLLIALATCAIIMLLTPNEIT